MGLGKIVLSDRLLRWDILLRGIFWLGVLSATWLSSSCMEVFHVTSRSTLFEPLFHIECGGLNSESICLDIYFLLMYSKVTEILTLFRFLSWRERMCTCTFESAVISARPSWRFTAVGLHGAVLKTYTICALIFCVAPMGQACVTCGATQGLPALVYSKADFRLYTRIVLFAAGHDGLVSVTSNIVRKIDIFGVLSLTSYPMHLHCHLRHTHLKDFFFI